MSRWPCSWFRKPVPPYRPLTVGAVVHNLTADDAREIRALGVKDVRISYYGDLTDLLAQLAACQSVGLRTIVVNHAIGTVLSVPSVVQYGNEPTDLVELGGRIRSMWASGFRDILPPGIAHGTSVTVIRDGLNAGLGDAGVICQNFYGEPLQDSVAPTLVTLQAAGWTGRVIATEIGALTFKPQAYEIRAALDRLRGKVDAAYVYVWRGDDGFSLTPGSKALLREYAG